MHKGIILLAEAENRAAAISTVKEFMEEYEGNVWDWWRIGGRWANTLSPFFKDFNEKSKSILKLTDGGFLSTKEVEEKQPQLQAIWEELGGKGSNPYFDEYSIPEDGEEYDVIPLSVCIEKVNDWQQTFEDARKSEIDAKKWLQRKNRDGKLYDDWNMYGYCLKTAANLYQEHFCFDCNIFNTSKYNYSIPEILDGWFAVMIDIHN